MMSHMKSHESMTPCGDAAVSSQRPACYWLRILSSRDIQCRLTCSTLGSASSSRDSPSHSLLCQLVPGLQIRFFRGREPPPKYKQSQAQMTKILAIMCNRFRKDYTLEGHSVRIPTKPAVATPPHTHTYTPGCDHQLSGLWGQGASGPL